MAFVLLCTDNDPEVKLGACFRWIELNGSSLARTAFLHPPIRENEGFPTKISRCMLTPETYMCDSIEQPK